MSPSDPKDEMTALVIRSAHELATRSSLVIRGLRDVTDTFLDKSVESTDDRAQGLFDQGKYDEAISICNAGLNTNPKDVCLWLIKGMCFSEQGNDDELLHCAMSLINIDDKAVACWSLAAKVLHRLHRSEEELKHWERVLEIDPDYKGAWAAIGDCLLALGNPQDAVHAFDSELKLNPEDDYCLSRRETVLSVISKQEHQPKDRNTVLAVSLLGWYSDAFDGKQLAPYKETRHLNLVCQITNMSKNECLLGKEISMLRRSKETGEMSLFADALIVGGWDSTFKLPLRIAPYSEVDPIDVEVTWTCPLDKTDPDCVEELFDSAWETIGRDDKFGTLMRFTE